MKKILLLVAALLVAGSSAMAQARFGVRGGLSLASSSFGGKDDFKASSVTGLHAGILFETGLFPYFSLQPEVLFDQRGSKIDQGSFQTTITTNYATIPLFLKASFPITGGLKANVHAGPYVGLALGGKAESNGGGSSNSENVLVVNSYDKAEATKTQVSLLDYGAVLGVGASYDILASLAVFVDVRYALGFAEVMKYAEDPDNLRNSTTNDILKASNRAVQISAGVSVKIGE